MRLATLTALSAALVPFATGAADPVSLDLTDASAEAAYDALAEQGGGSFEPRDGVWSDDRSVTLRLVSGPFWQAFRELGRRTGYEPLFQPYGEGAAIMLSRVDLGAEQLPTPAAVAGPLLVRPAGLRVLRTPRQAQVQLQPAVVAVEAELFVEPSAAWVGEPAGRAAIYATVAGLRASGTFEVDGGEDISLVLRRAGEFDPTIDLRGGIGKLLMAFDADPRAPAILPTSIPQWRGLIRIVYADEWMSLKTTLPRGEGATSRAIEDAGPYFVVASPVVVRQGEGQPGRATVSLTMTRDRPQQGRVELGEWMRMYHFAQSAPPTLVGPDGIEWQRRGYIVSSNEDEAAGPGGKPNPLLAKNYQVWASYVAPEGAADDGDFTLEWRLPSRSSEERIPLVWDDAEAR